VGGVVVVPVGPMLAIRQLEAPGAPVVPVVQAAMVVVSLLLLAPPSPTPAPFRQMARPGSVEVMALPELLELDQDQTILQPVEVEAEAEELAAVAPEDRYGLSVIISPPAPTPLLLPVLDQTPLEATVVPVLKQVPEQRLEVEVEVEEVALVVQLDAITQALQEAVVPPVLVEPAVVVEH